VTILTRRSASCWYSGTWSSRVRVWFGDQLTVPALETRVSLLASVGTGPRGTLPSSQSGVKVPRLGGTALKQKSKVKVTFMRLWELVGESGKVTVHLPAGSPARIARPVGLRGNSQATNCSPKRLIRVRAQLHCPVFIRTGIDSHVAIVVSLCADGKIEDLTNVA
jgi:hypothetical protein